MPAALKTLKIESDIFTGGALLPLAKIALDVALQPIVETISGEIYGYESLMRGHDKLGFPSPLPLLDAFERARELRELEHFTSSRALAKFSSLPECGRRTLFLNLDHRLIVVADKLIDELLPFLRRNQIAPSSICVELSERFDNASLPNFPTLIARMRKLGFKIAIDDFGTGHGEMKLLSDFDLDYVKIDRHLIHKIAETPKKKHITKSICDMAHVLGLRVIAEGVETLDEFLTCRDIGIDLVQGWFVARPAIQTAELKDGYLHLRDLGQNRRRHRSIDEVLIRQKIEKLPAIYEHDPVDKLFDLFRNHPQQAFFPVLNANDEPRGIVQESRLKVYIYQPYGRDLLKNRIYGHNVSQFVDAAPMVEVNTDSSQLMAVFSSAADAKCVILTENMRYAGVISAASLIKIINEKQVHQAQDQNPLTGMPGNQAIRCYLEEIGVECDVTRHICYCDFDNFKPFNDHYGFQHGDEAIALFARLMKRYFFSSSVFLGHIGGDDFFAGITGWSNQDVQTIFERLLTDFENDLQQLYSTEDRERGYISGLDRSGQMRHFDLMRCSVAIIEIPPGRMLSNPGQVSHQMAELKKRAKGDVDGLVFQRLG
jgi:diguanylate cyclase (GGDEF)-like protein